MNLLVIFMGSTKTIGRVNTAKKICEGSKSVLATTLYFTRLQYFVINTKKSLFQTEWCSIGNQLFGSHHSISQLVRITIWPKKRNTVSETLSIIFLVSSDDTPNRGNLTLEPADHKFVSMWFIIREPTVHEMTEVEEKLRQNMTAIYKSGLVSHRKFQEENNTKRRSKNFLARHIIAIKK